MSRDAAIKAWASSVGVGDQVAPIALWNQTASRGDRLPKVCTVHLVLRGRGSQTGVMFEVRNESGNPKTLDASWFKVPGLEAPR